MGRPPKSKKLKVLEGNRGRRGLDYHEPEATGRPEITGDLDADAIFCWNEHIDQIVTNGGGRCDSLRIAGMCRWYSLYIRVHRLIEQSATPDYRQVILAGLAWKNYDAAASRFGLSPTDRARLKTEKPAQASKWDGLLAGTAKVVG